MNLYPIVFLLASAPKAAPERAAAFRSLFDYVHQRVRVPARTRKGTAVHIPPVSREDVAHDVLLVIVENPGRLVGVVLSYDKFRKPASIGQRIVRTLDPSGEIAQQATRLLARYIETMLAHRWLTLARRAAASR